LFATVLHILIGKFLKQVLQDNLPHIKSCGNKLVVGGGCIFNKYLQSIIISFCEEHKIEYIPTPQHLCIDNSQMVIMHANHILENLSRLCETTPFETIEQKAFEAGLRMPLEVTSDSVLLNNEKVGILSTGLCYNVTIQEHALFRIDARQFYTQYPMFTNQQSTNKNNAFVLTGNITVWF
jgi:hypothetical protein